MPITPDTQPIGLDYDFLRYIEVVPETQRRIHAFYLPRFAGCHRVLDLGCGDGDFVALLRERSVDVLGIDADPKTCAAGVANGLPIVQADVFDYLAGLEPDSVDGIFSAHLVEHLPYEHVMALIDAAFRALRPGGVIVLATPDTRSIFSHLEMFYLHFGHISFYHPRLLCFLLEHAGFANAELGANPETASPLLAPARAARDNRPYANVGLEPSAATPADLKSTLTSMPDLTGPVDGRQVALADPAPGLTVTYDQGAVAVRGPTFVHRLSYRARRWLTRWLLKSELDDLAASTSVALAALAATTQATTAALAAAVSAGQGHLQAQQELLWANQQRIADHLAQEMEWRRGQVVAIDNELYALRSDVRSIIDALQSINGPFESYATATKPCRAFASQDIPVDTCSSDVLLDTADDAPVHQADGPENSSGPETL